MGSAASPATAPASPVTVIGLEEVMARVEEFMAGAHTLTDELWAGVSGGPSASDALTELVEAARAADGGKYLRPRLVAAAYYAFGGTDPELLRRVAAAQQLLHVGLCVHDDLIDGDRVRHGRVGVVARVEDAAREAGEDAGDAGRRGMAAGVLSGDLAMSTAVAALVSAPASTAVRLRLAEAALAALEQAIAGETLDVWSETAEPATSRPLVVAALKTASYSITLPLVLGAVAAGMDDQPVRAVLAEVGEPLGVAYQLRDDDLGLFGEPATTGKSVVSDLRDGKRTEHVRLAAQRADPDQRRDLDRLLGDPDLDDDGAEVLRTIIVSTGARAAVLEQVDALLGQALEAAEAGLPPALSTYLVGLTATLRDRER
ncbi:polyprenyl synthetase family protein [Georgenia sp. Z1491]|uniref:polyprenyl synthetase family protein n=1 Tax=Georgenia sp. Z1491 TaxID=3416707 RepID=UPI003CF482A2